MSHSANTEPVIGKVFEKLSPNDLDKQQAIYEQCQFIQCSLVQGDLSGRTFRECSFERCDLSLVKLANTSLQEVHFIDCKLVGTPFSDCRKLLLAMSFERCLMKLSLFMRLDLKYTAFIDCELQEADFTETNLTGSRFEHCDLKRALFFHTNLEKVDFRTAINYTITPESNRLRKAKFTLQGLPGLLEQYDIEID